MFYSGLHALCALYEFIYLFINLLTPVGMMTALNWIYLYIFKEDQQTMLKNQIKSRL